MADLIETVFWIVLLLLGWAGPALKRLFERRALEELEDDEHTPWRPTQSATSEQWSPPLPLSSEQVDSEQFSYDDEPPPWAEAPDERAVEREHAIRIAQQRALAAETVRRAREIARRESRRRPRARGGGTIRLDRNALLGALVLESSLTSRRSLRIRLR